MKRKYFYIVAVVLASVMMLAACGGGSSGGSASEGTTGESFFGTGGVIPFQGPIEVSHVGFSIEQLATDFASAQAAAVEAACAERGWTVEVHQADNDNNKQVQQCEDMISKGVDILFLKPLDESSFAPVSQACEEADIPLFVTSTYLNSSYTACAMADQYQIGVRTASILIEHNPGTLKKTFVLRGPLAMETFNLRAQGQIDTLIAAGYEIVYETSANNIQAEGLTAAEDFISTGQEFDSIICGADGQAIGAAIACQEAGLADQVYVMGNGGMLEAAENIAMGGQLDGTIYLPPSLYVDLIFSVVDNALAGNSFEHQNFVDAKYMGPDNVRDFFPNL